MSKVALGLVQYGNLRISSNRILREIILTKPRRSKIAVFAILGAVKFDKLVNFGLEKVQKFLKFKIQSL